MFDRHARCEDCGFPIAGAHCFSYDPEELQPDEIEVPREPLLELRQRQPGEKLTLENLSPEALEILANIKRKAQGKELKKKEKEARKRKRKEVKAETEKMLAWRTYKFFLGRQPISIPAPNLREAQRIAVEVYGENVWPITEFE